MDESIRVLHVDDDAAITELTAEYLTDLDESMAVVTATSVSEALATLGSERIDCVVSDYDMQEQTGIEFLETVRETDDTLPFILFTGKGSEEIASEAIGAGVTDYLQKGVGTDQYTILANRIRNAVEAATAQQRERRRTREYRTLVEVAPIPIVVVDRNAELLYCNSRAVEMLGASEREALVGQSFDAFVHPDDRSGERARVERLIDDREPVDQREYRLVDRDGETRVVHGAIAPVTFENESAAQIAFDDVTEQRARQRALEATNERLDTVVSNVPIILFALDPDGTFTLSEGTGLEALGLSPGEVVGESVFDVYEDADEIVGPARRALSGDPVETTVEIAGRVFETTYQPVLDDGEVSHVIGVATDVTERTTRERELRESNERLQLLFENAPDPIIVHDVDGRITDVNETAIDALGYSREELLSMTVPDIEVGVTAEQARQLWAEAESGSFITVEGRHRRADGSEYPADIWISPIEIDDERRFLAIARDISERKSRDRELQRYQTLVEAVGDPMYILDEAGHIEFANAAMIEYLESTRSELVGRHASTTMVDGDFERGSELLDALLAERDRDWELYEITVVTDEGRHRHAECNVAPLTDDDGEFRGSVGSVRDISERKRRQNAFEALHEVATTIQTEEDVETVCQRTVEAAADILEFSMCTVVLREGEWLVPYATSEDAPPDGSRRMRLDQGLAGETYRTGTVTVVDEIGPDDGTDPANDSYRSGLSVPIGDHGVFQAVSTEPGAFDSEDAEFAELLVSHTASAIDRIQREQALERRNERLDEFASIVSHDIRNPLNVAQGHLELARAERDDDHLETIAQSHDRIGALIDDLLALARQGDTATDVTTVDLADVAGACWETVDTRGATLSVTTDLVLQADRRRLRQLLENLFRNAVEHGSTSPPSSSAPEDAPDSQARQDAESASASEPSVAGAPEDADERSSSSPDSQARRGAVEHGEPTLEITIGDLPDGTGFYVEDDGQGLPEGARDELFESGFTTAADGTGFGLAIVGRIVDAHGWTIEATESETGGARFEITGVETAS